MSKKKINFDSVIYNLDGSAMNDGSGEAYIISKTLANNLVNGSKGDTIKLYDWAKELYKSGSLELDRQDFQVLKEIVERMENVSILWKAQTLNCFDRAEIID
jgi:hypothetical protein